MLAQIALICSMISAVCANTEKTIFLGPPTVNIASAHPALDDLRLHTLTPQDFQIRTHLEARFPINELLHGKPTWLLLDQLREGQRYEVRVCWAATQPTAFKMNTYELQTVFETPELISELSEYSWSRQSIDDAGTAIPIKPLETEREASVLFLQILVAADYYTTNTTLMRQVPPVYVDIILDPFVYNILPRSLIPTVAYILIVAVTTWFLAQRISLWIREAAKGSDLEKKDQ
ncbi:hypothetical protein F5Y15DRAFT_411743 [Xylariaceae sp. FL0016]|nr:hypothetical protein F5Y15DRAFT_411743 [Xylariaceae sp. FL0016]